MIAQEDLVANILTKTVLSLTQWSTTSKLEHRIARLSVFLNSSLFPQVSSRTVWRHLFDHGLKGYIMHRKPLLKRSSKFKRMAWCWRYWSWTVNQWRRVIFSNKSQIFLFGSNCYETKSIFAFCLLSSLYNHIIWLSTYIIILHKLII